MNRRNPTPWDSPSRAGSDGLVGVGGDLLPRTLLRAYSEGVFPWFNEGDPILWWSPDPRAIIELDGVHVSHSLARTLRSNRFRVTIDTAFEQVIRGCADRPEDETWITDSIIAAYTDLHRLGHAHSLETWVRTDADTSPPRESEEQKPEGEWLLAGGIYGVAIGALFAGESMFHRVTDGSKVALVSLVRHLKAQGFQLFDVQMVTDHTRRMGAVEIPRADYLQRLKAAVNRQEVSFA